MQCAHEVDDGCGVELTGHVELGHDNLTERSCSIEQRQEVELGDLEAVVDEIATVPDHRIDVPVPGLESFDLDPGSQLRPPSRALDRRCERLPDVRRCAHRAVDGECRLVDTTSVARMTDGQEEMVLSVTNTRTQLETPNERQEDRPEGPEQV